MASALEFEGRVAWVSGAASGIGRATARLLSQGGASLALLDIDGDGVERLACELRAAGTQARAWQVDVTDAEKVASTVQEVVDTCGALHLAVNNAGVSGYRGALAEQSLKDWHRVIDANLHGVFYAMRHQIPCMLRSEGNRAIVNIASVLSQVGSALSPAYTASKHAVLGLTRSAALAYADQGLRINAVGPGYIDTPLLQVLSVQEREAIAAAHPAGRLGRDEEVAQAVAFLLSPRASFCFGAMLMADGGFTVR